LGSGICQYSLCQFLSGKPSSGIIKRGKPIRIPNGIFQGFIPGFYKGIVIAHSRPGIASGNMKAIKKHAKGDTSHRMPIISMNKLWNDLITSDNPAKQLLGKLIGLLVTPSSVA
jgi:hypothetical protein